MTVRAVKARKEMDMGQQPMSPAAPSNNAPMQPQQPAQEPMIPDHTHPEYDQLLVKIQELENSVGRTAVGGVEQESLDEGKPENDKGKPTGNQQPIMDNQGNQEPKMIENLLRKLIREELKGVPERDIGKDKDPIGPDNTNNIPQSTQPSNGVAPSGGGFDSDDKTNKGDGDATAADVSKPESEYDKMPIQKNKMEQARNLIEKAKQLMAEANNPDPTQPNPEATAKDPVKMDGQVPNKSPTGGTEMIDGASEDPKANVPNDKRPDMKENVIDKVFENLNKEIQQENKRQSVVGMSSLSNGQTEAAHEEYRTNKQRVTNTVKEYLQKAGHNGALGHIMQSY